MGGWRRVGFTVVVIAVAIAGASAAQPRDGGESLQQADDAAVRAVWEAVDARWNARDFDGFTELFTSDAVFAFMDRGERMVGQPEIRETFARQFPAMSADLRHRTTVREVRSITAGVSTVDGSVDILRVPDASTTDTATIRSFVMAAVMLETPDGWRIRELHVHLQVPE
jgi:uncharacterized protein (TIGR02246 family)